MSPLTTKDLKRIFEKLDQNHDGLVSIDELKTLFHGVENVAELGASELEAIAGKSALDFYEFLLFCKSISKPKTSSSPESSGSGNSGEDLLKAFMVFDLNGDGFISCDELRSVLVRLGLMDEKSGRDCKTMINAFDANSDGQLDFEEFKDMMLLTKS